MDVRTLSAIAHSLPILLLVVALVCAGAQTFVIVRGSVTDAGGAAVPSVKLELLLPSGISAGTTTSDATGQFVFGGVAPGSYVLLVPAANGFASQQMLVRASAKMTPLHMRLGIESVTQTLTVSSDDLTTEAAENTDAVTLTGNELEDMPVFDQDYLAAMTPYLDQGSISAGGMTIIVDGVEMKGSTVSPSAIAEVRVGNDPYAAEYGRPGRGRIEIMSKPGSQQFHGTGNLIFRDAALNADNYFSPIKPPEQRRIYEGEVTGPAGRHGRANFVASVDRREEDVAAVVHAVGLQGPINENVSAPNRRIQISARVTRDFSSNHRFSVGYNFEHATAQENGAGGIVLPEAGTNTDAVEHDLIFNDRLFLSPLLVNQLAVTIEKDEDQTESVTNAAGIQVQGSLTEGGAQADVYRTENTIHINEVMSWTHKNQYLRFGFNGPQLSRRAVDDHTNRLGTFSFNSLVDLAGAKPYVYTVQQGTGRGTYWINELGWFVQDEIQLSKALKLTAGLRYQFQTFLDRYNNLAPRLSMAWSATPHTVLRLGSGIFYDRTGGDFPGTFVVDNGVVLRQYQLLNPGYPAALGPSQNLNMLPVSLVRLRPDVRTPYTIQYSATVERQIGKGIVVSAGYRGFVGVASFRSRDANAPLGPLYTTRPDPQLGFVQQVESGGRQLSNAMDVSMRSQGWRWFRGQAQYTVGRIESNTDGIRFYPQDPYNPNNEWGRASFDQLQRLNLIGNVNPGHWLSLGVSASLYSGMPYTETAGVDTFHTGLSNARPAGVGRNSLEGGGTGDLDLQWAHKFQLVRARKKAADAQSLNISAGTFNVLNHPNFQNYVGNLQSALFGHAQTAMAGRQLQFGVRYEF
jgi:hypothetical protein